jgi:hypothetical protein
MDNYSELFSEHEPDLLLRELNGNILWYWKPMSPYDKRVGCVSNAPFEAVDRIKKLEAALQRIVDYGLVSSADLERALAVLEGEKKDD